MQNSYNMIFVNLFHFNCYVIELNFEGYKWSIWIQLIFAETEN